MNDFTITRGIVMKLTIKLIQNILFGGLILVFLCSIYFSLTPSMFGYKIMTVLSGSMEPDIKPGDVVIDKDVSPRLVKVGDVITYKTTNNILITHRVLDIEEKSGQVVFKTKGDANNVEDEKLVSEEDLVGTLVLRIPYVGYALHFVNSRFGLALFILIPIFILLTDQVITILSELKKVKTAKSEEKDNMDI
jgi:signal peptidase I